MNFFKKKNDTPTFKTMDFNFMFSTMVDSSLSDDDLLEYLIDILKTNINKNKIKVTRVVRDGDGVIENISIELQA